MFKLKVDEEINLCLQNESYAARYVELGKNNSDYLSEWLQWPRMSKTEEDFKQFIQNCLHDYADGKSMVCAVEYRGEIVGAAGYNKIDTELSKVEIGYWIAADVQGKGIITRICKYLIDYAFNSLYLNKVEISVAEGNKASRAVCERLGMKLEGIITHSEKLGDRIVNHAVYGLHSGQVSH